ncbi:MULTISPECIES: DUF1656 domain-containing protein [Nitrospirillum]|uniref:DUF1656 domain-containing protein n=2 Tax=Nitrospirillum TaxID=1543705 RepID=A0A248JWF8_9PROT|nr:DUF1656 domain-containing protein [Nitrospirillum amazonense]ASG23063.1 DUF1656 domain-containing protein [Nitrospirillum amazonense CBAmc]MEC4594427.1 DUF1656 domain-containing protein [Nitrospirillum amazonense]TWB22903.1 uncharacterized protein DUF1656 [Nitrospirillum amazonense]TWB38792.1 uncharacterized protein DUF1656 [Nitrospirillum amazonense]TWB54299.1 uncharacterized protein DUF1656 [Nitrospirillum amazonense]
MAELDVAGIFMAPIVGYVAATLVLFLLLRGLLAHLGFWRAVWHPALVEAALFSILLAGLVLL